MNIPDHNERFCPTIKQMPIGLRLQCSGISRIISLLRQQSDHIVSELHLVPPLFSTVNVFILRTRDGPLDRHYHYGIIFEYSVPQHFPPLSDLYYPGACGTMSD
ncbi:hypothetical protein J6590_014085 [Homalodisca vitripennis]|nr:hypothetical protein J6590_014085 [Homalodisca vitripennis]